MHNDRDPKYDEKRYLVGLVAEQSLPHQSTWPTAQECQDVQCSLGNSSIAFGGSPLVQSVSEKADATHDNGETNVCGYGNRHVLFGPFLHGHRTR